MPTIVSTPGAVDANSFQALADLDLYLSAHPYGAVALARSEADRQSALIVSARLLSFSLCYEGSIVAANQALSFPRSGLTRQGGWGVSSETVPAEIMNAQAELARLILSNPTTDPTAESRIAALGLTKLKAGTVELGFKENIAYSTVPKAVLSMIPSAWICQPAKPRQVFATY